MKSKYFKVLEEVEALIACLREAVKYDNSKDMFEAFPANQQDRLIAIAKAFDLMLETRQFFYGEKWKEEIRASKILIMSMVSYADWKMMLDNAEEFYKMMDQFAADMTIDEVLNDSCH